MSKLTTKTVVWLTGASSGIGEALTYELDRKQVKLIISSRRMDELERVKSNCQHLDNIRILPLDLAIANELPAKAAEAKSFFGPIDILINNGGISQRENILQTDIKVDRKIMEVNYFGAIALSKAVLPEQIEKKQGHHVVMSSAVGIISTPMRSSYSASKHALHGFYDALRTEHFKDNIKVTIACPGFIRTNISINALRGDGSKQNKMDEGQDSGMSPETCAHKIITAIQKNKEELYIGGIKEVGGIYLKRFWPWAFARVVRKMSTT